MSNTLKSFIPALREGLATETSKLMDTDGFVHQESLLAAFDRAALTTALAHLTGSTEAPTTPQLTSGKPAASKKNNLAPGSAAAKARAAKASQTRKANAEVKAREEAQNLANISDAAKANSGAGAEEAGGGGAA